MVTMVSTESGGKNSRQRLARREQCTCWVSTSHIVAVWIKISEPIGSAHHHLQVAIVLAILDFSEPTTKHSIDANF